MRPLPWIAAEPHRLRVPGIPSGEYGEPFGAFQMGRLRMIVSSDMGWEHVSVSTETRTPTWKEMCAVKDLFWGPDEVVIQFHPPQSAYVNYHPHCLHMWKPVGVTLPLPPEWMVGPKTDG